MVKRKIDEMNEEEQRIKESMTDRLEKTNNNICAAKNDLKFITGIFVQAQIIFYIEMLIRNKQYLERELMIFSKEL